MVHVATGMKRAPKTEEQATGITAWHDADDLRWAARNWAASIGVKPIRIQIRSMRNNWASISTTGSMTLDTVFLSLWQ